MIVRTTKTICEVLGGALLGVMLLASIAGWRLAQGPVPLEFLTPHLVRALNGTDSPFRVTIDRTNLAWAGWERALDIRVVGVRATAEDGREVANIPEMSVGISVVGILQGVLAPTGIDVIGATMRLGRKETGALTLALGNAENENANAEVINRLILAVQSEPDPKTPATYLKRIRILNARLVFDDRFTGMTWKAPQADVVLLKEAGELRGNFFAKLDIGGSNTELNGTAIWRPNSEIIRVETDFSGIKIDRLAATLPALKSLDSVRLELAGSADLILSTKGSVKTASFDLRAGRGRLEFTKLWPEALPIVSAQLSGSFDAETEKFEIKDLVADIGGPKLFAQATAIKIGRGMNIDSRFVIDEVPLDKVGNYWPVGIGGSPRSWVTKNITFGRLVDTDIALSLNLSDLTDGTVSVASMSGTLKLEDMTIHHVTGLPPVKSVGASAVFSRDRFIAKIRHGISEGLTVTSAEVRLTELRSDNEQAEIDVFVEGPLSKAFALLDRPPLRFASRFGVDPGAVAGKTDTQLKFSFPLLNDLPLNKVDIKSVSRLQEPKIPNLAFGRTVSADLLTLKVDSRRMELAGFANIGGLDTDVKWIELFGDDERYPRRYEAKGILSKAQRDAIGFADLSPYLEGTVGVDVTVLQPRDGPSEIALNLELKDAKLWLPGFRWTKPVATESAAWLRLLVAPDGGISIPEFNFRSPDLSTKGQVDFDRQKIFSQMTVENFVLGRTQISGRIASTKAGGFDVDVKGATFDAESFIELDDTGKSDSKAENNDLKLPPINLQLNIDRVWFDDKTPVDRLTGSLRRDFQVWRDVNISGLVGQNQKVTFAYNAGADKHVLVVRSDNAGDALRALDSFDNVQGGTMTLRAQKQGDDDDAPWLGSLDIENFVLVKAPVMAKILTIASFSGIRDTLAGRGIKFSKLKTPFQFSHGVAKIINARTVGAEVGFTANGTVNMNTDSIRLAGTIVPAYTLNSMLGHIPIIGKILTGKDGSGIFAATYQVDGSLENPKVSVNPLAALAPGFLRNLIGVFDGSVKADKAPDPIPQAIE
jgi:hypothetical protein